jgi:hypothetical protein
MRCTLEEVKQQIAAWPDHVKTEILAGFAYEVFGLRRSDPRCIDTERPLVPEYAMALAKMLRRDLLKDRPELTVKEVIRSGELEIEAGHTLEEIVELACECLNAANSWDICGEVLFLGNDGKHYCGTVEFVVAPANPVYVSQALGENKDEEDN